MFDIIAFFTASKVAFFTIVNFGIFSAFFCFHLFPKYWKQKKMPNETNENKKKTYANKLFIKKRILKHYALNPFFKKLSEKVFL